MSSQTTTLVLASDLHSRPVIAIDCGDDIAEIRDVVFDPVTQRLDGFTLNKRGWFRGNLKATLPANAVRAIGPDAVMVDTADMLVSLDDTPAELDTGSDSVTVLGTRVLSAAGEELGEIADVIVAAQAVPIATGYKVAGANGDIFVPITAQRALSDANLVLPESAAHFVHDDLTGFGAAIASYRSELEEST